MIICIARNVRNVKASHPRAHLRDLCRVVSPGGGGVSTGCVHGAHRELHLRFQLRAHNPHATQMIMKLALASSVGSAEDSVTREDLS